MNIKYKDYNIEFCENSNSWKCDEINPEAFSLNINFVKKYIDEYIKKIKNVPFVNVLVLDENKIIKAKSRLAPTTSAWSNKKHTWIVIDGSRRKHPMELLLLDIPKNISLLETVHKMSANIKKLQTEMDNFKKIIMMENSLNATK